MKLDIVIPTCNRQHLLRRTLNSLGRAERPEGLDVRVIVVDNNSRDDTPTAVEDCRNVFGSRLIYLHEPQQGKPYALNSGIASGKGDLVGLIDDDEEVHPSWLAVVERYFRDDTIDFIGGPYVIQWTTPRPRWMPDAYNAVIGAVAAGSEVRQYGPPFMAMLMGGNAVIRRSALRRCGPYDTHLSRTPYRPMSGEDEDMYHRLLATGARGLYVPELIIYHHLFSERLTKPYFRKWAFWNGVAAGYQYRQPSGEPLLGGIPRWTYRTAAEALLKVFTGVLTRDPARAFEGQLDTLRWFGLLYGRHRLT